MNLSKNLTLAEAVKSVTAIQLDIDNTPKPEHIENMKLLAENVFQPVRDHFGVPIGVNSMYRRPRLNLAVGGHLSSQHMEGKAMDLDADIYGRITNIEIFEFIRDNLDFDQLIIYTHRDNPDFVHVSYNEGNNRRQIFFKDRLGYHPIS